MCSRRLIYLFIVCYLSKWHDKMSPRFVSLTQEKFIFTQHHLFYYYDLHVIFFFNISSQLSTHLYRNRDISYLSYHTKRRHRSWWYSLTCPKLSVTFFFFQIKPSQDHLIICSGFYSKKQCVLILSLTWRYQILIKSFLNLILLTWLIYWFLFTKEINK